MMSNNTLSRAELDTTGTIKNIHYGDVLIKFGDTLNIQNDDLPYIKDNSKIRNPKYLANGDVIIADTAEDETVGKSTEIYGIIDEKVVSGLHTIPVRPLQKFASKYLGYYINSPAYHNQLLAIMQGIKVYSISKSNIANTVIKFPNIQTQSKIAELLCILDRRIEKQHKLIDSIKSYKRGLENIVFSPKYSTIISVFDMLTECVERSTINNQYPIISSTKQGLFMQSEYFNKQAASINTVGYKILKIGQIVFSPQNLWMGNINYNNKFEIGIVSPSYKVYKVNSNYDSLYVGYLLKSNHAIKEYILASEQGASIVRRNLDMQLFGEIKFSVPDITRQRKFSHLLNEVDLLIQKYSSELTLLDKTKVYLLQQLFI